MTLEDDDMVNEYRIKVTVKNNLILTAILGPGLHWTRSAASTWPRRS